MESFIYTFKSSLLYLTTGTSLLLHEAVKKAYPNLANGKKIYMQLIEADIYTDPVSILTASEFLALYIDNAGFTKEFNTIYEGITTSSLNLILEVVPLELQTTEYNKYSAKCSDHDCLQLSFLYVKDTPPDLKIRARKENYFEYSNTKLLHAIIKLKLSFVL